MARLHTTFCLVLLVTAMIGRLAAEEARYFDPGWSAGDCACASACDCSCGPVYSCIYFQADVLYLSRDNRTNRDVVIRVTDEATPTPGATILTTGSPTFDWQPGVSGLLGWEIDPCRAIELSYFGVYNWHGSAVATGDNDLAIPGDLGLASLDFFAADRIRLDIRSTLHNAEGNYVLGISEEFSALGGFRYVGLSDTFNIRSTDLDTGTSNYNVQTSNNLFGGQVGLRWLRTSCNWDWSITSKAGIFANDAIQRQIVEDFPPPFILRDSGAVRGTNVAFVGDINLTAMFFINDMWSLRTGYNLLWIEGVALAQNQLDFTDTPDSGAALLTSGGFFAQGLSFGVESRW